MNKLVIFFISIFLISCSTTPVSFSESLSVAPSRIYEAYEKYSSPIEGGGKIVVVRDDGLGGSASSVALFVDGELVARLNIKESIVLHVDKNRYLMGVTLGWKSASEGKNINLVEQVVYVEAGESSFFRIMFHELQGLILQPSSQLE